MLSYEEAPRIFAGVSRIVVDEIHALAESKRGDQLMLGLARLQTLAPGLRRVGLSATVEDPPALAAYLGPGDAGPPRRPRPRARHLDPRDRGAAALGRPDRHLRRPRGDGPDPRRHHHPRLHQHPRPGRGLLPAPLGAERRGPADRASTTARSPARPRQKVEAAMVAGELRAIVATGSLDLGIDWGDVDLVVQVGAPKNVKRLVQRIGRANHRYNAPSRAVLVPSNRFEVLECRAALDAVHEHDPRRRAARPRPARRPLPAHPAHRLRRPVRRRRPLRRGHDRRPLPRPAARRLRRLPRLLRHRRLRAQGLRPLAAPGRCATAAGSSATRAAPAPSG